jgi:hypothetical protein
MCTNHTEKTMKHHLTIVSYAQKLCLAVAASGLLAFSCTGAQAAPVNLVKNGGFEQTTGTGQIGYNTTVDHWTSSNGYNFVFGPGEADTTGATSWFGAPMTLWGSNNGGANPLASSANGGNFIAADGDYGQAAIQQLIEGLIIGASYVVNFEWAAAQQYGFSGETTEWWTVNLGDDPSTRQATGIYSNASHSSSGWMQVSMLFTATSTSEMLTFLAAGTPAGEPPFSLLDGVSMHQVPEPSSWLLMMMALATIVAMRRKHHTPL